MLSNLWLDTRHAARRLLGAPGFTAAAVLTIALSVGANAAIFGVAKSVLLDSLPYADAGSLVRVYGRLRDGSQDRGPLTASAIADIADRQQSFASLAAFTSLIGDGVLGAADGPRVVRVAWVEPELFDALGVAAAQGRMFRPDEAASGLVPLTGGQQGNDTASAIVLSHDAWQRLFGADPAALGRKVIVSDVSRTVVGVLPEGFVGVAGDADFYLAFDLAPVAAHPVFGLRSGWLGLVGRLKPGVSQASARAEIAALWEQIAAEHPADYSTQDIVTMPLRDAMVGDTRTPLLVLLASGGLVLLVACANLAGVLLSRALSRRREFAVRAALGAGIWRLVRQPLCESVLLGLAGGAVGLVLASVALAGLRGLVAQSLPSYAVPSLDGVAILVTASVALLAGLAFGAIPAFAIGRTDPQASLREEARGTSETRRSRALRGALVACQLALSISLLVGAGLLGRSLLAMSMAPLGFAPEGVLTATVRLPPRDYPTPEERAAFYEQVTEQLRGLPGVEAVATASALPTAVVQRVGVGVEGAPADDAVPFVLVGIVSDDYFRLLQVPLKQGRTFDARDRRAANAAPTAIISESMARRFWPNGGAFGARFRFGPNRAAPLTEVVGIVGDVRNDPARPDAEPMMYMSARGPAPVIARFLVKASGDPLTLARSAARELAALNADVVFDRATLLRDVVGQALVGRQLPTMLISAFGVLALLLSSIGVYAMFASMVAAREGEIAVRMALGSRPGAVARLVLRQGAGSMAVGLLSGMLGVLYVARLLRGLLFGVSPFDPVVLGAAIVMLAVCATVALLLPLRRAMRVEPADVLRAQ
ncbi:MAG TPA: ABC transporter permease [Gammaproteobacteria bacterium]|nr:ABC transporter permease [Gammaproteobacteria bacterium]